MQRMKETAFAGSTKSYLCIRPTGKPEAGMIDVCHHSGFFIGGESIVYIN